MRRENAKRKRGKQKRVVEYGVDGNKDKRSAGAVKKCAGH